MNIEKIVKRNKSYSVSVSNSKVESLRINDDVKSTVRVYDNGFIGVEGKIGFYDDGMVDRAKAKLGEIAYPCLLTENVNSIVDDRKQIFYSEEEIVPSAKRLLERLRKAFPDFIFNNKITYEETDNTYENDKNTRLTYKCNRYSLGLVVQDKKASNIMDVVIEGDENYYDEDKIFADTEAKLNAFRNKVPMPEEKLPIIIGQEILGYIGEHMLAERYVSGTGLLSGKLGQKVFSDKLNWTIDRAPGNHDGVAFFDTEGVINKNYCFPMVENGVLKGLLTTKRSASQYELPICGSSNAAYDGVPSYGYSGMNVCATANSIDEIVKKGIYISITSGGDMTPSGDIGMPVMLAYLYENGKLVGRVPDLMISGNIFDILGDGYVGAAKSFFNFDKNILLVLNANITVNK